MRRHCRARSPLAASSLLALLALLTPSPAAAGPYAGAAMGEAAGRAVGLPTALHVGGSYGLAPGRSQSEPTRAMLGGGFLEVHLVALVFGLAVDVQSLPELPRPLGERVTHLRARTGFRAPLVTHRSRGSTVVPAMGLLVDFGPGLIGGAPPGADHLARGYRIVGRFELLMRRRTALLVEAGYGRTGAVSGAPAVRHGEIRVGISFHLAGERFFDPREPREPEARPVRPPAREAG